MSGDVVAEQIPPLTVVDRAAFVVRRFCEYRDALLRVISWNEIPENQGDKKRALLGRMRELADELAFEDLQAVLGRRGTFGLHVEVALRELEQSERKILEERGAPYDHLAGKERVPA